MRGVTYACASMRGKAQLITVTRRCPLGSILPAESLTTLVRGTMKIMNRRTTPMLGSLVVEIDARSPKSYVAITRLVLDAGDSAVETCEGAMAGGPVDGEIALLDAAGLPVSFDGVKHLPEGVLAR